MISILSVEECVTHSLCSVCAPLELTEGCSVAIGATLLMVPVAEWSRREYHKAEQVYEITCKEAYVG